MLERPGSTESGRFLRMATFFLSSWQARRGGPVRLAIIVVLVCDSCCHEGCTLGAAVAWGGLQIRQRHGWPDAVGSRIWSARTRGEKRPTHLRAAIENKWSCVRGATPCFT